VPRDQVGQFATEPGLVRVGAHPGGRVEHDGRALVAVATGHPVEEVGEPATRVRREAPGEPGVEQDAATVRPDVQIAFPVHPNPNVEDPVSQRLGGHRNIQLLKPLPYVDFVDLMRRAYLLLSDSGGIQEEAPSLGKPVLILRNTTERPEAVDAGTAALVGTQRESIVNATAYLLDNPDEYRTRSTRHNPFGDGGAASRISDLILSFQTK